MTQRNIAVNFIAIASTFFDAGDIPSVSKVANDRLSGAFRDANELGDITGAEVGVARKADQDMAVISEKSPLRLV